jgi:hypothetical protein
MNSSLEVRELFTALSKAQGSLKGALKDSNNPFFKSSYADLESCWIACRAVLAEHGLSVIQTMDYENGTDLLVTMLAHSSGQWIQGKLRIVCSKPDAQSMGSAITYSRRYSLAAIVGLTQTDDDGNAASNKSSPNLILPEDPGFENGNREPLHYKIPFGKYREKTIEQIDFKELQDYVLFLENKAKKDNKEITGVVAEFIARADEYICSFENTP